MIRKIQKKNNTTHKSPLTNGFIGYFVCFFFADFFMPTPNPTCKDNNARFTTVPLKPLSD